MTAYRFNLVRDLRPVLLRKGPPKRVLGFAMLNPSGAAEQNPDDDQRLDDPTVRRCKGFGRREGCDGIHVVNVSHGARASACTRVDPTAMA